MKISVITVNCGTEWTDSQIAKWQTKQLSQQSSKKQTESQLVNQQWLRKSGEQCAEDGRGGQSVYTCAVSIDLLSTIEEAECSTVRKM